MRMNHAGTSVWLNPKPAVDDGIIANQLTPLSVLYVIAAGGETQH